MKITLCDNELLIACKYDPEVIAQLKTMGAKWSKKDYLWKMAATGHGGGRIQEEFGARDGFVIEFDRETKNLWQRYRRGQIVKRQCLDDLAQRKITASTGDVQSRSYQDAGTEFIGMNAGCMLAFDMRLGKTKTAIDHINRAQPPKVLIVCPKSLNGVWESELELHGKVDYNYNDLIGIKSTARKHAALARLIENGEDKVNIFTINYDSIWRGELGELIKKINWSLIVADECQRIKAAGGKCSRYMLTLKAERKVGLTGTPFPHSPLDIYGQYRFLDSSVYGANAGRFKDNYVVKDFFGGVESFINLKDLYARFEKIAIRLNRNDVFDFMPQLFSEMRAYRLDAETQKLYDDMEKNMYLSIKDKEITAANVLSKIIKLQQITSGFIRDTEGARNFHVTTQKLDILDELITNDIPPNARFIIFYRFDHDRNMITKMLEDKLIVHGVIHGGHNDYELWLKDETTRVLVIQIRAGGLGLNLSVAQYVIYYSLTWSLGDYEQSLARIYMPGQDLPMTAWHLLAAKTIDMQMYYALLGRRNLIQDMMKGEQ